MKVSKTTIATAVAAAVGASASMLPSVASAVGLVDGFYDMTINNTPFTTSYQFGTDGAYNSSFTFGNLPGSASVGMYDDTIASPVNGKYAGNVGDGLQGTVKLKIEGGVITGEGGFEFDMLPATAGGDFVEYGGSSGFTGSVDASGNISLTPTGTLGAVGDFSSLVDEKWNVNDFDDNTNTAYDSFSTGSATSNSGTINGAAWDGTTAILVKGGQVGSDWGGFFGANYLEVWNVGFTKTGDLPTTPPTTPPAVPVPAAVWLFGSGLMGLVGVARRRKSKV
jgi:hypothetical protein